MTAGHRNYLALEAPFAPLGLAPYEINENGDSEFSLSMAAIDIAFEERQDNETLPPLPAHIVDFGKVLLYSKLQKQANRNNVGQDSEIGKAARQSLMPDQLIELIRDNESLRAVELGRRTHIDRLHVSSEIHFPMTQSLLGNAAIDSVLIDERPRLKTYHKPDEGLLSVEIKQKRMQHLQSSLSTYSWLLVLVDMKSEQGIELFADDLRKIDLPGEHNGAQTRVAKNILHLVREDDKEDILYPMLSTWYTIHPERLDMLDAEHRDLSPNLPIPA